MYATRYLRKSQWMCAHCEHITDSPWGHKHFLKRKSWIKVVGLVVD